MANWETWTGTCTLCGKKGTFNSSQGVDPNKSGIAKIDGRCPKANDGRHIVVWIRK